MYAVVAKDDMFVDPCFVIDYQSVSHSHSHRVPNYFDQINHHPELLWSIGSSNTTIRHPSSGIHHQWWSTSGGTTTTTERWRWRTRKQKDKPDPRQGTRILHSRTSIGNLHYTIVINLCVYNRSTQYGGTRAINSGNAWGPSLGTVVETWRCAEGIL